MLLMTLLACPTSPKEDTGVDSASGDSAPPTDTAEDTGPSDAVYPLIQYVNGECGGATCTWELGADNRIGTVTLDLLGTGWDGRSEHHDAFAFVSGGGGGEEWAIELTLVTDLVDQVEDVSTTFDVADAAIANGTTVLFVITNDDGDYADCVTYGDDPSAFAAECKNNANKW